MATVHYTLNSVYHTIDWPLQTTLHTAYYRIQCTSKLEHASRKSWHWDDPLMWSQLYCIIPYCYSVFDYSCQCTPHYCAVHYCVHTYSKILLLHCVYQWKSAVGGEPSSILLFSYNHLVGFFTPQIHI